MRIATWNVNSIRQRLDHAVRWLGDTRPDVVCIQEIKCQTEAFPKEPFEALGYNVTVHGQKGFNGVALLSRLPLEDVTHGLAGDDGDEQARFIEAVVSVKGASCGSPASICPTATRRRPRNTPTSWASWPASTPSPPTG